MWFLKTVLLAVLAICLRPTHSAEDDPNTTTQAQPDPGIQPIFIVVIIVLILLVFFGLFLIYWFCIKRKAPRDELSIESITTSPKENRSPAAKGNQSPKGPRTPQSAGGAQVAKNSPSKEQTPGQG